MHGSGVVASAPQLVHCGGDGSRLTGGVPGNHGGGAVFAQSTGEGQHGACDDALLAVGHHDPPENPGIGLAQGAGGVGQSHVEGLEGSPGSAVHQRKGHHCRGEDGRVPYHGQPQVKDLQEPQADGPLGAQQPQQEIAHHGGGEDQGEGEDHVQHALHQPGQLGYIVGRQNAQEEDEHSGNGGNAQRIQKGIEIQNRSPALSNGPAARRQALVFTE